MAYSDILDAQIYVGTYGQYNEGSLFGKWFALSDYNDAKELFEDVREYHNEEDDPEFMIQDFEGFPEEFYSESMGVKDLQKVYEYFEVLSDVDNPDAFITYIEHKGITENFEGIKGEFKDRFFGEFDSEAEFAEVYLDSYYADADIPDLVRYNIDFQSMWDGSLRHEYTFINGFVFSDY